MPAKSHKISNEYTSINEVKLLRAGRGYFNTLIELIQQAEDTIHIQVYTYNDDETGREVAEALMDAARRKVKVYLMTDGYASRGMPAAFIHQLQNAGIHFRFFEPVFRSKYFYFGRRMHHKVVVIDAKYALVGGMILPTGITTCLAKPPGSILLCMRKEKLQKIFVFFAGKHGMGL